MSEPLLRIEDLVVSYETRAGNVAAVNSVSLEVFAGKTTAIVGESGSGKSTTARAVIGLLPDNAGIDSGEVLFDGRPITNLSPREWKSLRGARIGLVPQDPGNSLNPVKTVGQAVSDALAFHGRGSAAERRARTIELFERVGIDRPEARFDQYPHELSGGMKQRVLIAAAIAPEPDLIIADEPTSALDVTVQKVILDLLEKMQEELGLGILLITHDLAVAGDRADHIVVMEKGEVRESGVAAEVLTHPQQDYTRRLLADAPSLSAAVTSPRATPANTEEPPLLIVDGVTQRFGADFLAVDDVSFAVPRGRTHAIVGQSGSGKSTLGRAITGFRTPTAGHISIDGVEVTELSPSRRRRLRRQVQLVYQNPYSSLDPRQNIGQIIAEPLRNYARELELSRSDIAAKVERYLGLVALGPEHLPRRPRELSGGQLQRVAIARALILEPELVVLDEAVSALDVTVQAQILRLLASLQEELGLTYVFISHDLSVVRGISDTVTVMNHGQQVESGRTAEVFAHPQSEFTAELIASIPGSNYRDGSLNLGL
ncbi:dipeptide ABC transporter ATP-binding protein [Corynebacterium doosanense]|uniref:ABC transporter ATP-binding protein n=1 Tax=Corynebacterium doosanense CAU 212 = DSM 45436 TaxID=558173 RepID=A0A097IHU3_9CORY|nr:ABC transporter ATP-binding protein [Corynebacterium doosanense]AIT61694.1 ABC transporter ATP-binding protein [Corynebacterium doosanense CAU 212 = DSM 45436]